MNKHVVSRIICKRLKALGVKQDSQFYWVKSKKRTTGTDASGWSYYWRLLSADKIRPVMEIVSAFLASELGEMLPETIIRHHKKLFLQISKFDGVYFVIYLDIENVLDQTKHWDSRNLADALGLMLEYLIKNKLITI